MSPVRLVLPGERRSSAAIANRPVVDVLTGSGYGADGSDFAGFVRTAEISDVPHYPVRDGEVGVTDLSFPWGHVRRHGYGDGIILDAAAVQNMLDSCEAIGANALMDPAVYQPAATIEWPEGVGLIAAPATWRDNAKGVVIRPTAAVTKGVRLCGSTAGGTHYDYGTSNWGSVVRGLTVDMQNMGADARGFSIEGMWYSALEHCKVRGITLDSQVGFFVGIASDALGGTYWNAVRTCTVFGNAATLKGVGFRFQGGTGAVYPTQIVSDNCRAQYCYRGLEIDRCGAGLTFQGCAWESCADNGVTVTNHQVSGAPVFIGCESSANGGWGYSGFALCHETTAQGNGAGDYDAAVFRLRANVSADYYSSTKPMQAPFFVGATIAATYAAGGTINPTTDGSGGTGVDLISVSAAGGAGARVLLSGTTQIANASAPRQLLLRGGSNADYLRLVNGGNVRLATAELDLMLDVCVLLEWSPTASDWIEVSRRVEGSGGLSVSTKTANYNALATDHGGRLRFDATAANRQLTVFSTLPIGWRCDVAKIDASANSVTVAGSGCTFNGAATLTTTTRWQSWTIIHIGAGVFDVLSAS